MTKRDEERQHREKKAHLSDRIGAVRWKYQSEFKEPAKVIAARATCREWEARQKRLREMSEREWKQRVREAREAVVFGPIDRALALVKKLEASAVDD